MQKQRWKNPIQFASPKYDYLHTTRKLITNFTWSEKQSFCLSETEIFGDAAFSFCFTQFFKTSIFSFCCCFSIYLCCRWKEKERKNKAVEESKENKKRHRTEKKRPRIILLDDNAINLSNRWKLLRHFFVCTQSNDNIFFAFTFLFEKTHLYLPFLSLTHTMYCFLTRDYSLFNFYVVSAHLQFKMKIFRNVSTVVRPCFAFSPFFCISFISI